MNKVYGVGINDLPRGSCSYMADGKQRKHEFYNKWVKMLERCYYDGYKKHSNAYEGCSVDERWHKLSVFKAWFDENYIEGYELDKDSKMDSKIYSPETCQFLSKKVNMAQQTGTGVRIFPNCKRFGASMRVNGKQTHLGMFDTKEEANLAYLKAKSDYIKSLAAED